MKSIFSFFDQSPPLTCRHHCCEHRNKSQTHPTVKTFTIKPRLCSRKDRYVFSKTLGEGPENKFGPGKCGGPVFFSRVPKVTTSIVFV